MHTLERPTRTPLATLRLTAAQLLCAASCAVAVGGRSVAQSSGSDFDAPPRDDVPAETRNVGVDERLGAQVPLDLTLIDHEGNPAALRDLMLPGKPAILMPVYYRCPMICGLIMQGLNGGMRKLDMTAGEDFTVITFSFSACETSDDAAKKRRSELAMYGRDAADQGWHFTTAEPKNIAALLDAVGYRVNRTEGCDYAHPSSIVFIAPDGTITRYLNDVVFPERDLKLALVEASKGKIGSPMDSFLLFTCFQYDPSKGSFVPSAWKIMRTGGALTVVLIAGGLFVLWRRSPQTVAAGACERASAAETAVGGMQP